MIVLNGFYDKKDRLIYASDGNGLDLTIERKFLEYLQMRPCTPHKVIIFNTYSELLKFVESI
jgi:hypothetical protein